MAYRVTFSRETIQHLVAIDPKDRRFIVTETEKQLGHEPERETKNRKPLRRPVDFGAEWELRLGARNKFRVFYKVDRGAVVVLVLAVGEKIRESLTIAGKAVQL